MKLSEHVDLGTLLIDHEGYLFLNESGTRGCALGGATVSAGCKGTNSERMVELARMYPWAEERCQGPMCCGIKGEGIWTHFDVIAHMFDRHVMAYGYHTESMRQLVKYIQSIEPEEAEQTEKVEEHNERLLASR